MQSIELAESAHNVVDVNACTWLASFILSRAADSLLSQIAIGATVYNMHPIPVITG